MLTREDINDLFNILAAYRRNDPNLQDKSKKAAWFLSLRPYEKADVKEAIGAWFRHSKYWPEPAEIAALCPPLPEEKRQKNPRKISSPELDELRKLHAQWGRLVDLRRSKGIPATVLEAKEAGLSDSEWLDLLAERGLSWCSERA